MPDLASALADCVSSVATSAITGGQFRRQNVGTPEQIAPAVVSAMASGVVALVFGPEPTGLDNDEVSRCHYQMHIPTDPAHAALNLSHAAAVCLYEVRRAWLAAAGGGAGAAGGRPRGRPGADVRPAGARPRRASATCGATAGRR